MNTVSVVQGIHYGNVSFDRDLSTEECRQEMEDQARKSVEITFQKEVAVTTVVV